MSRPMPEAAAFARRGADAAICLGAMMTGFALDRLNLPLSPALCSDAADPLQAVRLHLALFPMMHAAMALAVLGQWLLRRGARPLRAACLGAMVSAVLLFAGMHLGAGAAAWLRFDQGWWPMLACMGLGMQCAAWTQGLLRRLCRRYAERPTEDERAVFAGFG